ncbi:MAG: hypothetical protein ACR2JM_06445 [Mycobacterium sp.]
MNWIALYGAVAVVTVAAVFVIGEWIRQPGIPAPDRPGVTALIAGALWPVVAVGLLELGLLALLRSAYRPEAGRPVLARL